MLLAPQGVDVQTITSMSPPTNNRYRAPRPAEMLGVDGEHTRWAEDEVVDVRPPVTNGEIVEHSPVCRGQTRESVRDSLLAGSTLRPGPPSIPTSKQRIRQRIAKCPAPTQVSGLAAGAGGRPVGMQVALPPDEVVLRHESAIRHCADAP